MSLSNHCHSFLFPPFGVALKGRNWSTEEYRYGYQGSEVESELTEDTYSTHHRLLNSQLGRWFSIDPMASQRPNSTPFDCMEDNPILYNDVLGDIVKYGSGKDKYRAFWARLFSRGFRNTFRERKNDSEETYTLKESANRPRLIRGGRIERTGKGEIDWLYSRSGLGGLLASKPRDEQEYEITIIEIKDESETKRSNREDGKYSAEFQVPPGGTIEYRTLEVPDLIQIFKDDELVYQSKYNEETDHYNTKYSDFQDNNQEYHATEQKWVSTGVSGGENGQKFRIDVNMKELPKMNSGKEGATLFDIRVQGGGGLWIRTYTKIVHKKPKHPVQYKLIK